MFVFGAVIGLHGPLVAWTTDLTPREIMGTSMGLYRMIGDLGFLFGPVILGFVLEVSLMGGLVTAAPFLVAAVWAITAGLAMLFARDPIAERRREGRVGTLAVPPGNGT
jgi:MFS family permease